ncbi:MAG: OmpA family protein [Cytophagaceae bacterium]|nr:OmpA family protein [Cytophagaceae bacterium]MDW8455864.1 OmpA family protein [Cytophagaceae bacterium]
MYRHCHKLRVIFALHLLTICHSFSQSNTLYYDEFDDDSKGWWQGKSDYRTAYIADGAYHIYTKNGIFLTETLPIDLRKDFSFELIFKFNNADKENTHVSLISYMNHENFFGLYFYSTKQYDISGRIDNKVIVYKDYSSANFVDLKKKITLRFEYKNNVSSFFINSLEVYRKENLKIPGNTVGINLSKNANISIDRFAVYQQNNGINLIKNYSQTNKPERLGPNINQGNTGVGMVLSADGNYMFICKHETEHYSDKYGCDDIYVSEKNGNEWGPLKKMPPPINNKSNNDIIAISPDNNTILMADTNCTPTNFMKFWVSHRTKNGWSTPRSMNIRNGYNKSIYSESSLSSDGRTIVLSMRRDDSGGSSDLYVCFLQPDSTWSEPKNLGNTVNTLGGDFSPKLAADNVTLYYSTDGKAGYGGKDIFVTRRLDDTWTNWSEPENLGPIINTKGWDAYYVVDAKGEYAYYNSDLGTENDADIYRVKLNKDNKPKPVVLVKGKTLNSKTNEPMEVLITFEKLSDGSLIGTARSHPVTGEYQIVLPYGQLYGYRAEKQGYITINENLDLTIEQEYKELERNLYLAPIEVGQHIKLNNVFFAQSKAELLETSYPELNRLVEILKNNPTMEIELRGYTDNVGDKKMNLQLSEDRVKAVKNYLISKGISARRITGKGYGGENPIADNSNPETRKLNRRVEFVIIRQ